MPANVLVLFRTPFGQVDEPAALWLTWWFRLTRLTWPGSNAPVGTAAPGQHEWFRLTQRFRSFWWFRLTAAPVWLVVPTAVDRHGGSAAFPAITAAPDLHGGSGRLCGGSIGTVVPACGGSVDTVAPADTAAPVDAAALAVLVGMAALAAPVGMVGMEVSAALVGAAALAAPVGMVGAAALAAPVGMVGTAALALVGMVDTVVSAALKWVWWVWRIRWIRRVCSLGNGYHAWIWNRVSP